MMSGQTFSSLRHHQGQLTTPYELPTATDLCNLCNYYSYTSNYQRIESL